MTVNIGSEASAQPHETAAPRLKTRLERLERAWSASLALSSYLPVDPGAGHHYYRALLRDLGRDLLARAEARGGDAGARAAALARELGPVEAFFGKRRFEAPAIAVFSCTPAGLFDTWRLAGPAGPRLTLAGGLDLDPLRRQLAERPPALVVAADKEGVRIFGAALGEIEELARLEGMEVDRHKQGGWSASAFERRQDLHARWNLVRAAARVAGLAAGGFYRRVHVAGPAEARIRLLELLPPAARERAVDAGPFPFYARGNEAFARVRELAASTG